MFALFEDCLMSAFYIPLPPWTTTDLFWATIDFIGNGPVIIHHPYEASVWKNIKSLGEPWAQPIVLCYDLCCLNTKIIWLQFTLFCGEQKLTKKSCLWSKNNKYYVPQMDVLILEFMSPGDKMLGGNYAYKYYMLK